LVIIISDYQLIFYNFSGSMRFFSNIQNCLIGILFSLATFSQTCPPISTYFGKTLFDEFKSVCRDTKGNLYAIGNTYSPDLPVTAGAFQPMYKADYESFIVKFDSCGTLVWCTYFGTQGFDSAERIAFSKDSSVVITGYTDGTDLPTTAGCFQSVSNGMNDCFIAKFNLNGQPRWISYFGGTQSDFSYAVSIDKDNNIVVGGTSLSPTIHTTAQSFQQNLIGATDAFIAKFNKSGQLKFATFYGGSNAEDIHDVTTDISGNIIAVGGSFSNNLSTTPSCLQASSNGGMEVYVIKLDSVGIRLFSTYIGGALLDDAYGVCVDGQKNIYLTGHTSSSDFYKTAVSYQTVLTGSADNYCLKLTPTGSLIWSTIFGGSSFDNNIHCQIDANDQIISLINTQSTDFPMLGTNNFTTNTGVGDLVVAKINSSGVLNWSSYKGGTGDDKASDLLLMNNKVLISGSSSSADFPVNAGNYQLVNNGQEDGFLSSLTVSVSIGFTTDIPSIQPNLCAAKWNSYSSVLKIDCDAAYRVIVYDLLGREIENKRIENNRLVFFSNLNLNQAYIVIGYSQNGATCFAQKILSISDSTK
jgi:hypothetical protein